MSWIAVAAPFVVPLTVVVAREISRYAIASRNSATAERMVDGCRPEDRVRAIEASALVIDRLVDHDHPAPARLHGRSRSPQRTERS